MNQSEILKKYEMVVILNASLSAQEKDDLIKIVTDSITKHGGKTINTQVWMEKQKFTFDIKKCTEGTYYLINFEGVADGVEKVEKDLRLNESILRSLVIQVEAHESIEVAQV